jgi:glycogen debranching enzyme
MLTILEGSTFCICDELGDVGHELSGFFADDTRFLSRFCLTLNGEAPLSLSSGRVEYFSAAFFLRNPLAGLGPDQVTITRERFVSEGMQDVVVLENLSLEPVSFELGLEFASDFADILSVKEYDFALGDPVRATPLPPPAPCHYDDAHNQFVIDDPEDSLRTQIALSRRGEVNGSSVRFRIELAPRERWDLRIDVLPTSDGNEVPPRALEHRFGEERGRVRDSLAAWQLRVPQLRADWEELEHSFGQSVNDLAALRMRGATAEDLGKLPAAGMPWFMSVFGRDTLITCLQTLLFGPELARSALGVLALLQAREDDSTIDAEPGKIVHEVRQGKAAKKWFPRYYGTLDATPLYLILLSETWRWTGDVSIARDFRDAALRALEWIDRYGDLDGDGFLEFHKRAPHGLDVQSWKDSGDSQRFHDGTIAKAPIAPCEVQGYVYDAKSRLAEIARDA